MVSYARCPHGYPQDAFGNCPECNYGKPSAATTESRVDFDEARNLIALALSLILDKPHAEHFGPLCPVCGLVTATQTFVKEWKP